MENNELITTFAKKGFLLDKECLEFFLKLGNVALGEKILEQVSNLARTRMITKKMLNQHYNEIKIGFLGFGKDKENDIHNFFEQGELKQTLSSKLSGNPIVEKKDIFSNLKIISSEIIPFKRIEVKDFVTHFKNRYNFFKSLLMDRKELSNLMSIDKIGNNRNFSIIALVNKKRVTKNKNIIIEVEDMTGRLNILVNHDKEDIMKKARDVVLDDIIALKCSGSGEFVYANDIMFLDSYITEKRKSEEESYALFISDMHIGSKLFLRQNFEKFIKWVNGEGVEDEAMREKIKKIKYIFAVGDNIDGTGVYPSQEALLDIKSSKEQYKKLAEYLSAIPDRIKIIMCPGQHDSVRVPEPQPPINEDFAPDLTKMNNVFLVSNPSFLEIECKENRKGVRILMYHGASMHSWIDEIEDLRQGQANLNPSKVVRQMLKHRHLSPMHSGNVYVPSEKEDALVIKEVPDIVLTGDMHRTDVDVYNNVLIICSSCWQSITPFEEKVGNQPDPCKVPMLNLKTREMKILDFS